MKRSWYAWIAVFIIAAVMIFTMPVTYKVARTGDGLIVYDDESMGTKPCTVTVTGKHYSYMSKSDYIDAEVSVNDAVIAESTLRFTYDEDIAVTQFDALGEYSGKIRLNTTAIRSVITVCYDWEKGEFTDDEAYKCTIYVPCTNEAEVNELLGLYEWPEM